MPQIQERVRTEELMNTLFTNEEFFCFFWIYISGLNGQKRGMFDQKHVAELFFLFIHLMVVG